MKKLLILIPILLVAMGGTYKFAIAKNSADAAPEPNVEGEVYVLPKDFLINLSDGAYAKLGVGLIFEKGHSASPEEKGGHGPAPTPPEGYGTLPQEPIVRSIVTDTVTGQSASAMQSTASREQIQKTILQRLRKQTDVHAEEVLFTDLAVQLR